MLTLDYRAHIILHSVMTVTAVIFTPFILQLTYLHNFVLTTTAALSSIEKQWENLGVSETKPMLLEMNPETCPPIKHELLLACASSDHSCLTNCGLRSSTGGDGPMSCSCDRYCRVFKDCCADFDDVCASELVEDSKNIVENGYLTAQVKCIVGHSILMGCPKDWNFTSNESLVLLDKWGADGRSREFVTDLSSGLAYENMFFLACNGGNTSSIKIWNPFEHSGNELLHERARICLVESFLICNEDFQSIDNSCDFYEIHFSAKKVCSLYSRKDTRQDFILFALRNKDLLLADFDGGLNDTSLVDPDIESIARIFKSSCWPASSISSENQLDSKNSFSTLFRTTDLSVSSDFKDNQVQFLKWCSAEHSGIVKADGKYDDDDHDDDDDRDEDESGVDNDGSRGHCVVMCKRNEIRFNGECQEVKTIDIIFPLVVREESIATHPCLSNLYANFVFEVWRSIPFLEFENDFLLPPNYAKIRFKVKKGKLQEKMTDPFLKYELELYQSFFVHELFAYKSKIDVRSILVCINSIACKRHYSFENYGRDFVPPHRRRRREVPDVTRTQTDAENADSDDDLGHSFPSANSTYKTSNSTDETSNSTNETQQSKTLTRIQKTRNPIPERLVLSHNQTLFSFLAFPEIIPPEYTDSGLRIKNSKLMTYLLRSSDFSHEADEYINQTNNEDQCCACPNIVSIIGNEDYCLDFKTLHQNLLHRLLTNQGDYSTMRKDLFKIDLESLCLAFTTPSGIRVLKCHCGDKKGAVLSWPPKYYDNLQGWKMESSASCSLTSTLTCFTTMTSPLGLIVIVLIQMCIGLM